ncbi:MAG: hypothetical protein ACLTBS_08150 [Eisenbergiella sp.]
MDIINYSIPIFKDIWVKDCYHMSIIPAVLYVKGNADIILFNQNFKYKINEMGITYVCEDFGNIYDHLERNGIENFPLLEIQDIERFICDYLKKQYVVVVGIDNYYEEIRKDFFGKVHSGHSVLIHGMDCQNKIYNIIEQPFFYSPNYDYYQLSYASLKKAYFSFLNKKYEKDFFYNNLAPNTRIGNEIPSICALNISQRNINSRDTLAQKNFVIEVNSREEQYIESVKELIKIKNEFYEIYLNFNSENEYSLNFIKQLSILINNKSLEKYLYDRLEMVNITKYIKEIIEKWKYIRTILSKFMLKQIYKEEDINNSMLRLQEIYILENNLIQERRKIFERL